MTPLLLSQLGPDAVPVVRAEVAAGYGAIGGAFNCGASFHRNWAHTIRPVIDRYRRHPYCTSNTRLRSAFELGVLI